MIEIKCYEVIGMCFFMLFCLTVKCQCKFYSKLNSPQTDVRRLLGNTGIHHIGAPVDLIVHSFPSVWGHFLVFRVNVSRNGNLICTFTSVFNWFNISDLLDVEKDPKVVNSPVLV